MPRFDSLVIDFQGALDIVESFAKDPVAAIEYVDMLREEQKTMTAKNSTMHLYKLIAYMIRVGALELRATPNKISEEKWDELMNAARRSKEKHAKRDGKAT
uniref:Uncharacterized protein n=1 Tax=viral metagenome TaxID=1070528 RepID=A0A6H2A0Z2_9ZZZZ